MTKARRGAGRGRGVERGTLTGEPPGSGPPGGVVFFDGHCALCLRSVSWLLARDRRGALRFAPLQGPTFARWRDVLSPQPIPDSLVYARGEPGRDDAVILFRSDAVLRALRDVGGVGRVLAWLRVVPRPLRDAAYDLIARRRGRWFGTHETCRMPTTDERARLLP